VKEYAKLHFSHKKFPNEHQGGMVGILEAVNGQEEVLLLKTKEDIQFHAKCWHKSVTLL
jgi:hypothetical protein